MSENKNIEEVIDRYNNRIQGVIRRFLRTQNDIDDLKQEVYIKTWKNLPKCQEKTNIWSWINVITINTCKDYLRRKKRSREILDSEEDTFKNIPDKKDCPEKLVILSERHKKILSAIDKLNIKFREVLIFHDIDELTYEEIAQKVNCPVGTVKSRLFNARKALRNELQDLLKQETIT